MDTIDSRPITLQEVETLPLPEVKMLLAIYGCEHGDYQNYWQCKVCRKVIDRRDRLGA